MGRFGAILRSIVGTFLVMTFFVAGAHAESQKTFRRKDIADARFGEAERQRYLQNAYRIREGLSRVVFGQETAAAVLEAKTVQYFESFPNRKGESVVMNMIGLPGVGKSAMLEYLKKQGFPVLEFDAQSYSSKKNSTFEQDLYWGLLQHLHLHKPMIVFVEELDKIGERAADSKGGRSEERTSDIIGTMNMIASEGKMSQPHGMGRTVDVSNVMFITTMNIAPEEFDAFSKEVLGNPKSYYDFSIEDFAAFDQWIRKDTSSYYKVLSKIFRSNTAGRLAANTTIMSPLGSDSYGKIIDVQIQRAIRQSVGDKNEAKRITVEVDPSVIDFLMKHAVYAPSGARETVLRVNSLLEQLINYGTKVTGEDVKSADKPRRLDIRYDAEKETVAVRVTEFGRVKGKAGLHPSGAIAFEAKYDPMGRIFLPPASVATVKPAYSQTKDVDPAKKPVRKKEVIEARFPVGQKKTQGLAAYLDSRIFGQKEAIGTLVTDFDNYFGRKEAAKKEPSSRALAGFPGIGKSQLFIEAAHHLELPIVRFNMQRFQSDEQSVVNAFLDELENQITQASYERPDGRFMLLIEELDKVFELDQMGRFVNRPIMAVIKDLLNDGVIKTEGGHSKIDVRGAFIGITMNFAVDLFGFEADPRLTSIDDVINAWKRLRGTPAAVKDVLGGLFLPDTVSRLMTLLTIIKPLDREAYAKVIELAAQAVKETRLLDEDKRNVTQFDFKMTDAYREYLMSETVIPSEGARNTAKSANLLLTTDLQYVLSKIPKSSPYATQALVVTLDYDPDKRAIRYDLQVAGKAPEAKSILAVAERKVALNFPPTSVKGRVTESRMHVSAHEFGHAFTGARLGARFEHIVVTSPKPGTGGYVKPNGSGDSAADLLARVYMILGSRALERIVFSPDPLNSESVLRITAGPSADIQMATITLYHMLYKLGMNPEGGTVDRNFVKGTTKYAAFQEMPNELAEKLGLILRDIEDQIVRETLQEHPLEWYVDKISQLARAGSMNEKEFYRLIERELPEANRRSVGTVNEYFRSLFAKDLIPPTETERNAASARAGDVGLTAAEQVERALTSFSYIVRSRLGEKPKGLHTVRVCSDLFQKAE